ncbi:MAG: FprA family A-type flavoprotein [Thermovenabulum sp.]|uniref:FprA family A-type flavoprotein n=1 Tax=Thermovenabulum sp. TaxID=3100335 RepID=UPI003C7D82A5
MELDEHVRGDNMTLKKIDDGIFWVGVNDWPLRDFHGLSVNGGSYNSYLLLGEKNILIDTVYEKYKEDLKKNIEEIIPINDLDFILLLHSENDHSSSLPFILQNAPKVKILCTKKCANFIKKLYQIPEEKINIIKDGDTIKFEDFSIKIYETPMVHWPDTTFAFIPEKQILFSTDFLGTQVVAEPLIIEDVSKIIEESRDYYTFLMRAYWEQALKGVDKVKELSPNIVAPSHGPILKGNAVKDMLSYYKKWCLNPETKKAIVAYVSMWKGTEKIAELLSEGLSKEDIPVKVIDLANTPFSEALSETLEASAVLLGTPTFVKGIHPLMYAFLTFLEIIKPNCKLGMAFGTYGWAGLGVKELNEKMKEIGIKIICEPLLINMTPDYNEKQEIIEKAKEIAKIIKNSF